MTDLSALSDAQLQALYDHPSTPDVGKMSDADLMAAYHGTPQVGMGEDALKSTAAGLGNATVSTLGMGGDFRSLLSKGVDSLGNKVGFDGSKVRGVASTIANMTPLVGLNNAPTSADIKATVTDPIVSPDYEPQYETGSLLKKGAEFAPNLLMGGPEGLGARLLTNVVAPAIGSEIGGKFAGPIGEIAGGIVGVGGATAAARKFQAMAAARLSQKVVPTAEDLLKTGSNQFDQARDMNIVLEPGYAQKTASNMRNAVKDFDPEAQKAVFNAIDRIESMGKPQAPTLTPAQRLQAEMNWEKPPATPPALPVEMNNIELARKQLSNLRISNDPSTRAAAKAAQEALTESQMALSPADTLAGNAADYTKTLRQAVGNYGAGKRAQTIEGKMNLAELNLNSPVGGLDMASSGQALQRTMKQLARPINNTNVPVARKLGFNPDEVAAITQAANGNKLTHLGDVANQVVPHWMGGGAIGSVLRAMGGLSVKRQVSALDSLVRSRSPLAAQVAAQLNPQIIDQLPAKSQRILQTIAAQPPTISKSSLQQQASKAAPFPSTQTAVPQRQSPLIAVPPSAPPIFATPKTAPLPTKPKLPSQINIGPANFQTTPLEGKTLWHETSPDNAARLLEDDLTNSVEKIRPADMFVTDNKDIAIGQGGRGVKIEMDGSMVSVTEHKKPGTNDRAGREYRTNAIGNNAIKSIEVARGETLPMRPAWQRRLDSDFTKSVLDDGTVRYERKH